MPEKPPSKPLALVGTPAQPAATAIPPPKTRLKRGSALCSMACAARHQSPSFAGAKASPRACICLAQSLGSCCGISSIKASALTRSSLGYTAGYTSSSEALTRAA
jgi:hypothetical protein